jgi:hypothetical protein
MRWNIYHRPRPSHTDNLRPPPGAPSFRVHHQGNLSLQGQRHIVRPTSLALARYSRHPAEIRGRCPQHTLGVIRFPTQVAFMPRPPTVLHRFLARGNRPGRVSCRDHVHRNEIASIIRRLGARAMVESRHSCRERWCLCYLPHPALCERRTYKIRSIPRFQGVQLQSLLKLTMKQESP